MKEYLVAHGIPEERIKTERESSNTVENLRFSLDLLTRERDGNDAVSPGAADLRVGIVTSNFHVTRALKAAFHPGRINYGAYNDKGVHLHYHLVPKYEGGFEWGDVFAMNPGRVTLTDEEYAAMIDRIKAAL